MTSFDPTPITTAVKTQFCDWICDAVGYRMLETQTADTWNHRGGHNHALCNNDTSNKLLDTLSISSDLSGPRIEVEIPNWTAMGEKP